MKLRTIIWSAAAATSAIVSQAHPGHAPFSEGTKHFLSSPAHLGLALLLSLLLIAGAQLLRGPRQRALIRAVAALIAVVALLA